MSELIPGFIIVPNQFRKEIIQHQIIYIGKNCSALDQQHCLDTSRLGVKLFLKEKFKWISLHLNLHYNLDLMGSYFLQKQLSDMAMTINEFSRSLHRAASPSKDNGLLRNYLIFLKDHHVVPRVLLPVEVYLITIQALKDWLMEEDDEQGVIQELGLKINSVHSMYFKGARGHCGFLSLDESSYESLRRFSSEYPLFWVLQKDYEDLKDCGTFDKEIRVEVVNFLCRIINKLSNSVLESLQYCFFAEDAWRLSNFLQWLVEHPDNKRSS